VLYNGYIFEDSYAGKGENVRVKQPDQAIKFDTLVSHFDISELISKAIEKEQITDDYRFQTYNELNATILTVQKDNKRLAENISSDLLSQTSSVMSYIDQNKSKVPLKAQYKIDTIKSDKKLDLIFNGYNRLDNLKSSLDNKSNELNPSVKYFSKVIIYQQRIVTYSFTCLIFFMIGASLGSIIRKGGMGLPVIVAIVIFIIFYVINVGFENLAWTGKLNPYLAAWLPNIILLPFGVWMTYKALTDSQLFDAEKYKALLKPITKRFVKQKEHQRYQ
jgi:lipopolysaccharide export system permease protein